MCCACMEMEAAIRARCSAEATPRVWRSFSLRSGRHSIPICSCNLQFAVVASTIHTIKVRILHALHCTFGCPHKLGSGYGGINKTAAAGHVAAASKYLYKCVYVARQAKLAQPIADVSTGRSTWSLIISRCPSPRQGFVQTPINVKLLCWQVHHCRQHTFTLPNTAPTSGVRKSAWPISRTHGDLRIM
jgi:hypothetical protein